MISPLIGLFPLKYEVLMLLTMASASLASYESVISESAVDGIAEAEL